MSNVIKFANVVLDDTPVVLKHKTKPHKDLSKKAFENPDSDVKSEEEKREELLSEKKSLLAEIDELIAQKELAEKQAKAEAQKIIQEAKTEADKINKEAAEKADFLFRRSENDGYDLGFGKGKADGMKRAEEYVREQTEDMINSIASKVNEIEEKKTKILESYEEDIKFLSVEIAEKIIKSQIELDDSFVQKIVKSVLDDYKNKEWIKLIVSSQGTFADCLSSSEFINSLSLASKYIEVKKDPDAAKDTIMIESEQEIVDASIHTQLKNINDTLKFNT